MISLLNKQSVASTTEHVCMPTKHYLSIEKFPGCYIPFIRISIHRINSTIFWLKTVKPLIAVLHTQKETNSLQTQ